MNKNVNLSAVFFYSICFFLIVLSSIIISYKLFFVETKTWIVYNGDVVLAQHCKDLWYDENYLYLEDCGIVTLPHYQYKIEYIANCDEVQVFTNNTRGLDCERAVIGRDVVTQWGYNDEN